MRLLFCELKLIFFICNLIVESIGVFTLQWILLYEYFIELIADTSKVSYCIPNTISLEVISGKNAQ